MAISVFNRCCPANTESHDGFQEQTLQITLKPREQQNVAVQLGLRGITESVEVRTPAEVIGNTYSPSSTALNKEFVDALPLSQKNNLRT